MPESRNTLTLDENVLHAVAVHVLTTSHHELLRSLTVRAFVPRQPDSVRTLDASAAVSGVRSWNQVRCSGGYRLLDWRGRPFKTDLFGRENILLISRYISTLAFQFSVCPSDWEEGKKVGFPPALFARKKV